MAEENSKASRMAKLKAVLNADAASWFGVEVLGTRYNENDVRGYGRDINEY